MGTLIRKLRQICLFVDFSFFFSQSPPQYGNHKEKYSTLKFCVWKPCILHPTEYACRLPFSLRMARLYANMSSRRMKSLTGGLTRPISRAATARSE